VFARSSTIRAQASMIDAGIAHVRDEVMPAMRGIDGYAGLSLMVDRESGRCIATSSWQSEEAMRASVGQVDGIRNRAAEAFGGTAEVEEWEVGLMHRAHPAPDGAGVRCTWTRAGDVSQIDRAIDVFKLGALPKVEQLEGFCSASLLVNRGNGRAVAAVTYDDRDALARTRDQGAAVRAATIQEAGLEMLEVAEFELALAHLHVPEMA
jgi:heme-degrading monooxygenase HmoA